ncbi:MAG: DUF6785 family protein, partial [Planctomycetota bacterium]
MAVAAVLVCVAAVFTNYHDGNIIRVDISLHNYAAPLVVALAFVFLLIVNAGLFRLHSGLALRSGELAVCLALALAASPLPRYFAHSLTGTVGQTQALLAGKRPVVEELQKANPYAVLPERAMLSPAQSAKYDGSISPEVGAAAPVTAVPWGHWVRPMLYWSPLVVTFLALSVSFGYVIYRQWARHELVSFPLAEFAGSLAARRAGRAWPDVFYNRLFWGGVGLMLVIFTSAGLHAHFEKMVAIPTKFSYYSLSQTFSFLRDSHEGYSLLRGTLYFTVVAVAFLLPSELSFTCWLTWPIMVVCTYAYFDQTGQRFSGQQTHMMMTGAWWGMALLIVYAGRRYYWG